MRHSVPFTASHNVATVLGHSYREMVNPVEHEDQRCVIVELEQIDNLHDDCVSESRQSSGNRWIRTLICMALVSHARS